MEIDFFILSIEYTTIHKYLYWDVEYQMPIDLIEDNKV